MNSYISELQDQFCHLANQFDDRSCDIVRDLRNKRPSRTTSEHSPEHFMQSSQDSIQSAKDQWRWLKSLNKALDKHLDNAMHYHVFHITVEEYKETISSNTTSLRQKLDDKVSGKQFEAEKLFEIIKNLLAIYMQWWQKLDSLVLQSKKVVPIRMRKCGVDMKRPAVMIVDYRTKNMRLRSGEHIFVVDNNDRFRWTVENLRGEETRISPVCCILTPPDTDAIDRAILLRLEMLSIWTKSVKEVGNSLVNFMLTVFQTWNTNEQTTTTTFIRSDQESNNKENILGLLSVIEDLLQTQLSDNSQFEDIRERIRSARATLSIYSDEDPIDEVTQIDINSIFLQMSPIAMEHDTHSSSAAISNESTNIAQKSILSRLLQKYQDFSKYWEIYKTLLDNTNGVEVISPLTESSWIYDIEQQKTALGFLSNEDPESWSRHFQGHPSPLSPSFTLRDQNSSNYRPKPATWAAHDNHRTTRHRGHLNNLWSPTNTEEPQSRFFTSLSSPISIIVPRSPGSRCGDRDSNNSTRQESYCGGGSESGIVSSQSWQRSPRIESESSQPRRGASLAPLPPNLLTPRISSSFTNPRSRSTSETNTLTPSTLASTESPSPAQQVQFAPIFSLLTSSKYVKNKNNTFPKAHQRSRKGLHNLLNKVSDDHGIVSIQVHQNDNIISVSDRRHRCQLTPQEAIKAGVMDNEYLFITDTETNLRYTFNEALDAGLLVIDANRKMKTSRLQNNKKFVHFRVFSVWDEQSHQMVGFMEAKRRGLINGKTAVVCCLPPDRDQTDESTVQKRETTHCDFLEAVSRGLVQVKKLNEAINIEKDWAQDRQIKVFLS